MNSQQMPVPTTYQLLLGGRILYFWWALFFSGIALFILAALFSAKNQLWPVYFFVGLVLTPQLGFAGYCALCVFKPATRIVVNDKGFSYTGALKTFWVPWENITAIRWIMDFGGMRWLEVKIKQTETKWHRVKLDLSGLHPNRIAFLRQVRSLAPWVEADIT